MRQYKVFDFRAMFNGCHCIAAGDREHQLWMCTRLKLDGHIVHRFQIRKGRYESEIKATFANLAKAIEEYNKCD